MKICNSCGYENGDNAKFCAECGEKLQESPKFCPECGTELVNQPKFCPECGTKVSNITIEVERGNINLNDEYTTEYVGNELIEDDESLFAQTPSFSITEKKDKIHKMVLNYAEQIGEKCIDWKVRNYESFPADKKELLLKIDCNFNYEDFATMFSIPNPLKLQLSAKFDYGIIFTIFGFYIKTIESLNSFTFVKYSEIVSCEVIKNEHIKIYISTKLKTMFGLSENFIECGNYLARPLSELLTELKKLDSEYSTDYLTSITTARADGLKTSRDRKYFMKGQINGYTRCSRQYEEKLRRQADLFLKTTNKWKKERSEYDALLDEYDATIVELEEKLSQVESPEYRQRLNNVSNYRDQLAALSY